MKKLLSILFFLILAFSVKLFITTSVYAATCSMHEINSNEINILHEQDKQTTIIINNAYFPDNGGTAANSIGKVVMYCTYQNKVDYPANQIEDLGNGSIKLTLNNNLGSIIPQKCWSVEKAKNDYPQLFVEGKAGTALCTIKGIKVTDVYTEKLCKFSIDPQKPIPEKPFTLKVIDLIPGQDYIFHKNIQGMLSDEQKFKAGADGTASFKITDIFKVNDQINYAVGGIINGQEYDVTNPICKYQVIIGQGAIDTSGGESATNICKFSSNFDDCMDCMTSDGIPTPFGCIKTKPQDFITSILKIAMGLAGGIAFLMIIYGGLVIMMSSGNPEKLNGGKEIITSAISGLLLIVFSVVILKIIGVDIFKIPGLAP